VRVSELHFLMCKARRITPVLKFCGEWSQSLVPGLDLLDFLLFFFFSTFLSVFCYVQTLYLHEKPILILLEPS